MPPKLKRLKPRVKRIKKIKDTPATGIFPLQYSVKTLGHFIKDMTPIVETMSEADKKRIIDPIIVDIEKVVDKPIPTEEDVRTIIINATDALPDKVPLGYASLVAYWYRYFNPQTGSDTSTEATVKPAVEVPGLKADIEAAQLGPVYAPQSSAEQPTQVNLPNVGMYQGSQVGPVYAPQSSASLPTQVNLPNVGMYQGSQVGPSYAPQSSASLPTQVNLPKVGMYQGAEVGPRTKQNYDILIEWSREALARLNQAKDASLSAKKILQELLSAHDMIYPQTTSTQYNRGQPQSANLKEPPFIRDIAVAEGTSAVPETTWSDIAITLYNHLQQFFTRISSNGIAPGPTSTELVELYPEIKVQRKDKPSDKPKPLLIEPGPGPRPFNQLNRIDVPLERKPDGQLYAESLHRNQPFTRAVSSPLYLTTEEWAPHKAKLGLLEGIRTQHPYQNALELPKILDAKAEYDYWNSRQPGITLQEATWVRPVTVPVVEADQYEREYIPHRTIYE